MNQTDIRPNTSADAVALPAAHNGVRRSGFSLNQSTVFILSFCAIATAILVFLCQRIELSFLRNHGFFFDPAAYYIQNIEVYKSLKDNGLWPTLIHEVTTNARCPGRTIPYLLLAPKLLLTTSGHLWTEVPLLFAFLVLLCSTVYERTKSLLFAIAGTCLFVSLPFLYNPVLGVGAYWLDFTSACAMGAAALCLLRYSLTRHNGWMLAFGAFASASAVCRWSAAAYLFFFLALALPATFADHPLRNWKRNAVSLGYALSTGSIGILFTGGFFSSNMSYYKSHGYALGAPLSASLECTSSGLLLMIGGPILGILFALSALNMFSLLSATRRDISFVGLWFPVSIFIFLCIVCKATVAYHPLVFFAPALFISALCWVGELRPERILWWRAVSAIMLGVALMTSISSYDFNRRLANNPPEPVRRQAKTDAALAEYIVATNSASFEEFDCESVMPQLDVFFYHNRFCQHDAYFSEHERYMTSLYPGTSPSAMAKACYTKVKENVSLIAVFDDPEEADQPYPFNNIYSATVARDVSASVKHDRDWQLEGKVDSPRGTLAVYRNRLIHQRPPLAL